MKGGGWLDTIYCMLIGWIFNDTTCKSSMQMMNDVKTAKFTYGGGKTRKRMTLKTRKK